MAGNWPPAKGNYNDTSTIIEARTWSMSAAEISPIAFPASPLLPYSLPRYCLEMFPRSGFKRSSSSIRGRALAVAYAICFVSSLSVQPFRDFWHLPLALEKDVLLIQKLQ
jgi:hypothetical protein